MVVIEKAKVEERKDTSKVGIVADWFGSQNLTQITDQQIREKIKEIGAHIDSRGDRVETILHRLAKTKNAGVGRVIGIAIDEFNARKNALSKSGSTPIRLAFLDENEEAVIAFARRGAKMDDLDFLGRTIEFQLEKNGKYEMLTLYKSLTIGIPVRKG